MQEWFSSFFASLLFLARDSRLAIICHHRLGRERRPGGREARDEQEQRARDVLDGEPPVALLRGLPARQLLLDLVLGRPTGLPDDTAARHEAPLPRLG